MISVSRLAMAAACALTFTAPAARALDLNNMTAEEQQAFGDAVRAYLLENPQVILEAVDVLEQQQAEAEAARDDALVTANLAELQNDGYSWVGGNPEGDITLVEFMDYRCGYCRKAAPEGSRIRGRKACKPLFQANLVFRRLSGRLPRGSWQSPAALLEKTA